MTEERINRIKCGYISERDLRDLSEMAAVVAVGEELTIGMETFLELWAAVEEHCETAGNE
jgi:hypothetical protein